MGHIAILLPREELVFHATELAKEHPAVGEVRCIRSEQAVDEATTSVRNGASVIVARGLQALRIAHAINTPLVQVRLTAQELGLLLMKAKKISAASRPKVALVAAENMLCDTSYCSILFGVELTVFTYDTEEQYGQINRQAVDWEPDIMIGGEHTLEAAHQAGIPALFLDCMEDSLREAVRVAETALYANETSQRFNAQFDALLSSTSNGYIQLDGQGKIIKINDIMCDILECSQEEWQGQTLEMLVPGIEPGIIQSLLEKGESYSTFLHIRYQPMVVILVPVRLANGQSDGLMLSCHKIHRSIQVDSKSERGDKARVNLAALQFEQIHHRSPVMADSVNLARLFSQSTNPVLLVGERGLERNLMAQCIHNNSVYRTGSFVQVNCGGLVPERQMDVLFGSDEVSKENERDLGALGMADNGTLFLMEIDKLIPTVQYNIYRALRYKRITQRNLEQSVHVNVRLIASSETGLHQEIQQNLFRKDLYYLLSGLRIDIPPLRERSEDLQDILQETFQRMCELFQRYHVLTSSATELLRNLPWQGNAIQIHSFIERMVLTAKHRSIDEVFIHRLWEQLYPSTAFEEHQTSEPRLVNTETQRILDALARHNGNRMLTADELGISTTTLWRKMKRLEIGGRYIELD